MQAADAGDDENVDTKEKRIQVPSEKVRRLMYQLIMDSKSVTTEEYNYLIKSVKLPEVRGLMADFF